MLSKVRKHLKFLPKFFTVFGAVSIAFSMLLSVVNIPVSATGQETCPSGNGWTKVDNLSGKSYTYNAPAGKLVTEWCYKAGTTVKYGNVNPPKSSVTVTSTVNQDLSHASFKLVNKPTSTPKTPTKTPKTPTNTPVVPTNTPVTPTATFTATNTPTNTPVPPTNTPTNTPVTPTNTPVPPTNTPTNTPVTPTNTPETDETPSQPTPSNTPVTPEPTNTPVTPVPEETPSQPTPVNTPVPDETPSQPTPVNTPVPDETPVTDETPDPTEPPVTVEPTLPPPVNNDPPTVLIPVTGIELGGNSPLSDVQNFIFNMGLTFLGLGLILQSVRKRFNF